MPKVRIGERNKRERALWEYICSNICSKTGKGKPYKNCDEFAEKAMGVTLEAFSKRKTRGYPRFFQVLCQMFRETHIKDYQLCRIFGVEYNGSHPREVLCCDKPDDYVSGDGRE